jgi:predicted site-specific integrase-resolvase
MDTENYISPNKITKQFDITSGTLRRWSEAGKIRCLRPNGGKRIYNIDDVNKIFSAGKTTEVSVEENLKNVTATLKQNIAGLNQADALKLLENVQSVINDLKSSL